MHKAVLILEKSGERAVFDLERAEPPEVMRAIERWILSAVANVRTSGLCKSFVVGVHVGGADCDHESGRAP